MSHFSLNPDVGNTCQIPPDAYLSGRDGPSITFGSNEAVSLFRGDVDVFRRKCRPPLLTDPYRKYMYHAITNSHVCGPLDPKQP